MSSKINEESVRKLVRAMLEGNIDVPIQANPNVEPLMNDRQLDYTERTPVDSVELSNIIGNKLRDLDDDVAPHIFKQLATIIDAEGDKEEEEETMTHEAKLRSCIRRMLREAMKTEAGSDRKRGYQSADDAGGTPFDEIAAEFGFAGPQGAKAAVEKALTKMRYLMKLPEEDRDFLVLSAMDDYINMLNKTGELTPEDTTLLRAHPSIVQDLDGFKEHLHKYVLRGMRAAGKEEGGSTGDE